MPSVSVTQRGRKAALGRSPPPPPDSAWQHPVDALYHVEEERPRRGFFCLPSSWSWLVLGAVDEPKLCETRLEGYDTRLFVLLTPALSSLPVTLSCVRVCILCVLRR